MAWTRAKVVPQPDDALIDVRDLIGRLSSDDLLASADAYFAGLTIDSEQCHKPFSNIADAIHIHRNLGLLLQAADLFRGAEVLDFGCATGWLTIALANLGCQAVGVDISPMAIRLAEELLAKRGVRAGGSVQFRLYAGDRLPFDDESLDRVVCFDAFHHVRDQAATLAELARVLRPGGRIAMLEPGPDHSKTPQSQMEMSRYNVIENDVDMTNITRASLAAGLGEPEMLVQLPLPVWVPYRQYRVWAEARDLPKADAQALLAHLSEGLTNTQCFYLNKAGAAVSDSRNAGDLRGEIKLLSARPIEGRAGHWSLEVEVANTGQATWLTRPGSLGQVTLGVQLLSADGAVLKRDFMRVALAASGAGPGGTQHVVVKVNAGELAGKRLRFDLVAEHVTWFSQVEACRTIDWELH